MIKRIGFDENNRSIYIDKYMEDNKIMIGRKSGSTMEFLVMNEKTGIIFLKKVRKKKLERILNENN